MFCVKSDAAAVMAGRSSVLANAFSVSTPLQVMLLASTALFSVSLALVSSVHAEDGQGGRGGFYSGPEVPSLASLTGAGTDGESGGSTGGSGGGAGVTGGNGGTSTGGDGGDGGAHAYVGGGVGLTSGTLSLTGSAGQDGVASGGFGGGGGGGGGGFGAVVTGASSLSVSDGMISGGDGGDGGGSSTHYGGTGGSGGSGLVLNNVSGTTSVRADVTGGDGGNGGDAANGSQNPGADGGTGIRVVGNSGAVTLAVSGVVTGGDGGNAGTSSQYRTNGGDGGAGISGSNINLVLDAGASVSGGTGGTAENGGDAGADGSAISFTGGSNSLELQANSGGSVATISGGISHAGGSDKLVLGGANDASLAVSGLNSGGLYAGFGSYEKNGSSTWSLTGTTTSTRNWSVADGTLRLLDASIGSGAVSIASGAALEINRTTAGTIANSISGAGSLTKSGSGTLTLTGTNSYSGGTAVSAGRIVGAASAIKGDVAVSSGATVEFDQAADATFGSVISGAGSLAKSGAGALTLTGTNTYTGDTAVTGGRLVGSTTAIRGDVAVSSGATVEYSQSSDATLSNVISGAGALTKSGAGTLTLTGANTYTGDTAITAGRLVGAASAIRGDVAVSSGATVEYSQSSDATVSDVISGAGALAKSGAGTLTLTGANTYAGGTAITGGRLVGSVIAIRGDVSVSSGAEVEFDQAADATVSGQIAGAGSLAKSGSGTLTLTGANSYAGGTTIAAGRLVGSSTAIRGAVSVSSGAALEYNQTSDGTVASAISGAGSLTKSGAGTLTLTGANSYAGGTTIAAGRLVGSSDAIRGDVSVSSGATVEFDQTADATLGTVVSGDGALEKSGNGTLTLTGTNTYGGGTTVSEGRLVGATSAIRGDVSVSSGTTVEFDQAADATLNNVVSGSGSLAKSGAGVLTLSGANTYTGGTDITAGRLVGSAAAIRGDVSVSVGAAVEFSQTSDATTSGEIAGAGSLTKSGAGTLTLGHAATHTGGTTVKGGRLVANTSTISGDIQIDTGATFRFDQAANGDYSGGISGSGSLEKFGAGVLTLTGNFSLTGKTSVFNGELIVAASNLGTSSSFDLSGGELTVSGGANATISTLQMGTSDGTLKLTGGSLTVSNMVTSTQALALTGAGTLNLDAAGSSIGGGVTLSNGSLIVGSSSSNSSAGLAGDVAVATGATLGGHGTVTGTVTNAGRLAPGNSIGTLTIAGNYAGTGTLEIEVDGDIAGTPSADKLIVNGTVDVSGTDLDLVLTPTTVSSWAYAPTGPFTIIDNDGTDAITGTFASVTDNLLFLDPLLDYTAGTGNDIALTLLRNDIDFASAASNSNQFSTAAAIEGLGYSNPIYLSVVSTASSNALAQAAFDSLSGEINASLRSVLLSDSRLSRGAVLSHLASADAGAPVWAQAIGNWNSFGHDGNGSAADSATGGFVAGVDRVYSDAIMFGVMGGYTRTGMSVGALASNASMESLQTGVYLGGAHGAWTYRAGLLGAYNMVETDRVAAVPGGLSQSLTSNQDVMSVQAFVETGYAFDLDGAKLEPFAGVAQVHLRSGGFSETGGSAALTAAAQSNDVTFSWVGLRAETAVSLFGVDATAKASAAWQHASAQTASFSHAFAGGTAFTIKGASFARDMALIETGIAMEFGGDTTLDLSYQGQFGKNAESHGFNARLSAKF